MSKRGDFLARAAVLLTAAALFFCSCGSSGNREAREVFKESEWISTDMDNSIPNQWVCFRKSFSCDKVASSAVLHIGVDSKYWLWVNGQMVIFEGGLKRGPNPHDTYYDSVPIGKYLKKGGTAELVSGTYRLSSGI